MFGFSHLICSISTRGDGFSIHGDEVYIFYIWVFRPMLISKPKKILIYYFLTNQITGKNKGKAEFKLKSNSFLKTQMPNT